MATDCSMKAYARKAGHRAGKFCSPDDFTSMSGFGIICERWRFAALLVETSPEILTAPIDFGLDLAVLFPFAPKGPVFEN